MEGEKVAQWGSMLTVSPGSPSSLADGCSPPALLRGIQMCGGYGYRAPAAVLAFI